MSRWCVVFVLLAAVATPAAAQSTYVGASLVGDIGRFNRIEFDDDAFARLVGPAGSEDGEALGFNLKIGREIRRGWGVEFEFARTGEFETTTPFAVPAFRPERLDLTVPPTPLDFESERRHTTFAALAWIRQELGRRVDISYLAGVAFSRVEAEFDYDGPRILIYPPITIPSYETIFYDVGPSVGAEAAFKFGAAAVTGGIRLQTTNSGTGSGWLVRPNVGMRWTF